MYQTWEIIEISNKEIVLINYITMEKKICFLTYEDDKTLLPKGWERWFSSTYRSFYYRYIDNKGREQVQWNSPKKTNYINQYKYSPKVEVKVEVNLDLKEGSKLNDVNGDIILVYDDIKIRCTVKTTELEINIRIIGKNDCLDFSIYKTKPFAYIHVLNVYENECPLPETSQGAFLLRLVDEICRQLSEVNILKRSEVNILKLSDESYIICNGNTVDLQVLSLMKYGVSWYERNGFSYESKTKKDIVNKICNTSVHKIKDFLTNFLKNFETEKLKLNHKWKTNDLENWYIKYPEFRDYDYVNSVSNTDKKFIFRKRLYQKLIDNEYDFSDLPDKIRIVIDILSEYQEKLEKDLEKESDEDKVKKIIREKDSLSYFLTYVWNKNCSHYVKIMDVLYPNIRDGKMYIDESVLLEFPKESSMIKVF